MSRPLSPGQAALVAGAHYAVHTRLWVANDQGALVDLSEYLIGATIEQGVDELVDALTLRLDRNEGESSLSPLMTTPPPVALGREVVFETAITANDAAPSAGDWMEKFRGTVRSIDPTEAAMTVVCQSGAGSLQDRWIEDEREYGSESPVSHLEDVMQEVLDDWGTGVTLHTPVSPQSHVMPYRQQIEPVLQAQRGLAESIGWTVRDWWDPVANEFRFSLLEPPREKTAPDWTMRPSRYLAVRSLRMDTEDIRNRVEVVFYDADGEDHLVTVQDAPSIAKYGVRFLRVVEGTESPIKTTAQAEALAEAILSDLADPDATHAVEDFYLPHLQLWDLLEFEENAVHYSAPQRLAVMSLRHEFPRPGVGRTIAECRGKPSGGVLMWRRRAARRPTAPGAAFAIQYAEDENGTGASPHFDPERHLYARTSEDGGATWTDWFRFVGPPGTSFTIVGRLDDPSELPVPGVPGDGYLIDGDLWLWIDGSWENAGRVQGPKGDKGDQGEPGPTGQTGAPGAPGQPGLMALLDNDSVTIPTAEDGSGGVYTHATTTVRVLEGASDVSGLWSYSATPSAGVTGSLSGRTYSVTAMSTDAGYVDITATRSGYPSLTVRFALSKARGGAKGDPSTAYWLITDASAIKRSLAGSYTPAALVVSGRRATGDSAPVAYAGRFQIATLSGTTWTVRYTSGSNQSSYSYTIPANVDAVRVRLYAAGGTTLLLDEEVVPVVEDGPVGPEGPQGPPGEDATAPETWVEVVPVTKTSAYHDLRVRAGSEVAEVWVYSFTYALGSAVPPPPSDPALRTAIVSPNAIYRAQTAPQGHERVVYFYAYKADGTPGQSTLYTLGPPSITRPSVDGIDVEEAAANRANITVRLSDQVGLGGTVRLWTAPSSQDDASPAGSPDATVQVGSTPASIGPSNAAALSGVMVHPTNGKLVWIEFINSQGVSSGVLSFFVRGFSKVVTFDDALAPAIVQAGNVADEAIRAAHVRQRELDHTHIGLEGIERENLAAQIIDQSKMDALSVGEEQMRDLSVPHRALQLDAVERENIADDAVDAAKLDIAELSDITTDIGAMVRGRLDNLPASAFIDLEATGDQPVIGHPSFALLANGDATFAGALVAASGTFGGTLMAGTLFAEGLILQGLQDGELTQAEINRLVVDGGIVAGKLSVSELSEIADDVGIVVSGELRNAAGTRYINLDATGTTPFIQHDRFQLLANGTATFGGTVTASAVLAAGLVLASLDNGELTQEEVTRLVVDGGIVASKMSVSELSELADDMGIVVSGELRNAAGTRYINLDATGTQPFLFAQGALVLRADGSATFGGTLDAVDGVFTGELSAVEGTFVGTLTAGVTSENPLSALNANLGTITAGTVRGVGNTVGIAISDAVEAGWDSYVSLNPGSAYFLRGFGGRFSVDHAGNLIATNATIAGHVEATSGSFAGTLEVGTDFAGDLSDLSSSAGTIVAGRFQNAPGDGDRGILLNGTVPSAWQSYISFSTAGGADFIRGFDGRFRVGHDGRLTATGVTVEGSFSGEIRDQIEVTPVAKTSGYHDLRVMAGSDIAQVWVYSFVYAMGTVPPAPNDPALRTTIIEPGDTYRVLAAPQGHERIVYFYGYTAAGVPSGSTLYTMGPPSITIPQIEGIDVAEVAANRADIIVRVRDQIGQGGVLRVWTAPGSENDPAPSDAPDAVVQVQSTPASVGPVQTSALANVAVHPTNGKLVWAEFTNRDGVSSGVRSFFVRGFSKAVTFEDALAPEIVGAGNIAEDAVRAAHVRQRELNGGHLELAGIERENLAEKIISAAYTDIPALSDITGDIGAVVSGRLDNLPASAFIDLEATGSQAVIGHPAFAIYADGDATFSGTVTAEAVLASGLVLASIEDGELTEAEVTRLVVEGGIVASRLSVSELSELTDDMGIVVSGELRNAAGSRYINLDATGTQPFIHAAGALTLRADGSATFAGELDAADGTFTGTLTGVDGTFTGTLTAGVTSENPLSALNANLGTITAGRIRNATGANGTAGIAISDAVPSQWLSYVDLTRAGDYFLRGANDRFTVDHAGNLTATTATITGEIHATSGTFAGTIEVGATLDGNLSNLSSNAGTIIGGRFQNAAGTGDRGIMLTGTVPSQWQSYVSLSTAGGADFIRGYEGRFRVDHQGYLTATGVVITGGRLRNSADTHGLNLNATGNQSVLYTPHVDIQANGQVILGNHLTIGTQGNATFSGHLSAASGEFAGKVTIGGGADRIIAFISGADEFGSISATSYTDPFGGAVNSIRMSVGGQPRISINSGFTFSPRIHMHAGVRVDGDVQATAEISGLTAHLGPVFGTGRHFQVRDDNLTQGGYTNLYLVAHRGTGLELGAIRVDANRRLEWVAV